MFLAEIAQKGSSALAMAGLSLLTGVVLLIFAIVALIQAVQKKTAGWVCTSIITLVLGLAALVFSCVQGFDEIKKFIADGDKIEQVMTTKNGRYRLTVPKGWSTLKDLNPEADLGAGNLIREQYVTIFAEPKADLGLDLPAFADLITQEMQKSLTNPTRSDFQKLTVGGFPALRCRLSGKAEGVDIVYQHTSLVTEDSLIQLMFWTLPDREKTAFPIFETVAATFSERTQQAAKAKPTSTKPEDRIRQIVIEQLGVKPESVTPAARLKEDLGADELDLVELVMAVEEEFSISIKDEQAEKWRTVGDILQAVPMK